MAAFSGLTDSVDIDEKDTDIELFRWPNPRSDEDSIVFMTATGELGIRVDGRAVAMPVERWHELALRWR